ncbi:MAG: type II toxin-antitoxin system RelE/ParE family toxin [Acidobacteriota bacterium]
MTVRWTPTALRDLASLHSYIADYNPGAASAAVGTVVAGIEALAQHPEMGRRGRVAGTRELVVAPSVVAYRARKTSIDVLAIIHGARRWPDSFDC